MNRLTGSECVSRFGSLSRRIPALASVILWAALGWSQSLAYEEVIYYHNDALGSPLAATDASGNVKWREAYAPFGARLLHQSREIICTGGACRCQLPLF